MRGRRKVLIVLVCLAGVAALAAVFTRDNEPQYEGHPLSYWVLRTVYQDSTSTDERRQTEQAIRHIGTNAFPFLLKWIQYERPAWRSKAGDLARRLPVWTWVIKDWIEESRSENLANHSGNALRILGEQATPFILELLRLLTKQETTYTDTARRLAALLPAMGTNAFPALVSALQDPTFGNYAAFGSQREFLLRAICDMSPPPDAAAAAVPILIHCLSETNIPGAAAYALVSLRVEPNVAVPALVGCLNSPDRDLRWAAAHALGEYGTNALEAMAALRRIGQIPELEVSALIACLQSSNSELRRFAVDTMGDFGTNAVSAVPALIVSLEDRGSGVAGEAANALARIGLEPGLVIPALTNAIQSSLIETQETSSNRRFRMAYGLTNLLRDNAPALSAVKALGTFGAQANTTLPLLTNLLSNPVSWRLRIEATNAIQRITASVRTNTPDR